MSGRSMTVPPGDPAGASKFEPQAIKRRATGWFWFVIAVVLAAAIGLGTFLGILPIHDLSSRPASSYASSAELAEGLRSGAVECDFKQQKIGREIDPGLCRDRSASAGVGVFLRTYESEEATRDAIQDFEACGYFDAIVGPNWLVIVDTDDEAADVLSAIGGRLVEGDSCD